MSDRNDLTITLTDEQARLYRESATFKAGVDAFLRGVAPHFLEGLARHATRHDADIQSRIAAVTSAPSVTMDADGPAWCAGHGGAG